GAGRVGPRMDQAAGAELLPERGILRIVHVFWLLLRGQVVEIAEELVEAVVRRQVLVQVAEMVFAELTAGITERLQQLGEGRVELGQPFLRARQTDLGEASADRRLAGDARGTAGGAAVLALPVGEP